MVGVFDTLSSADEIGFGNWRVVKNSTTRSTRSRQRGGGWTRLFAEDAIHNNQDLHDQLVDRLSYYESFSSHAMGGGGLSGYGYPYFFPTSVMPEHDEFPTPSGPYCGVYYPDHYGLYQGCPIFNPFVGYPYVTMVGSVSTTGLAAHWTFDSKTSSYPDSVGSIALTAFGVPSETGLIGNAATFRIADDDWLEVNTNATLEMGAEVKFGFTGWINRYSEGIGQAYVLGKWGTVGGREYRLIILNDQFRFDVSNNGTTIVSVTNTTTIHSGEWVFFACWHDPVANTINVRVNNGVTASASHTTGVYASSGSPFTISLDSEFLISSFDGQMDSLSLWKTSFPTEAELTVLYHSGMGLGYPFSSESQCTTGSPYFYLQSFVYISCPVHYGSEVFSGYGYGPEFPIYSSEFSYDYTYCGSYMYHRQGCREAVTALGEIVTSTGRKLIASTMSRVYEYNQGAGNWRIIADGLGNAGYTSSQCGCNSVRGMMASMGLYLLYTNNFDYPSIYLLGEELENCAQQKLVPISDLVALNVARAGGVVVWKGFAIFFDITERGTRLGGTFIWSDLEQPDSFIESDTSLAGRISIDVGQTILRMEPLGNWLICYTDKGIYRITLVGGEDIFNIEEIKGVGGNALKFKYSLVVGGSFHMWLAESDVMYFTQFDTAPIHIPWITKASGMIFNGISEDDATYSTINREACNLVTGGWNEEKREAWLSWPTGENVCPNVTLRFNMKFNAADFIDHGFTSFLTFRADIRPTVGQWMEERGICPRASQVAQGLKDGPPCSASASPVVPAPLYIRNPQESEDYPVHPDSLCAHLAGLSMDDFCVDCASPPTFITASAEDFTLKEQRDDVYYRQMLGGSYLDYDAYSCSGEFYFNGGYSSVMQLGANDFRTDDEKMVKMIGMTAEPKPQTTPSDLQMDVGYGSQSGCLTWRPIRTLPFECHAAAAGLRSDYTFYFPTFRRGRYLSARFRIDGIGGGGLFTGLDQMISNWGQQDSP
jgi:hypothetical protein